MEPYSLIQDSLNSPENAIPNEKSAQAEPEDISIVFECEESGCLYTTDRWDNMKRHKKQTHEKYKIPCSNCGQILSPTSLKRHMRSIACSKKKKTKSSGQMAKEPMSSQTDGSVIKVETIIRVNNGIIEFTQEPIKIGELELILVPQMVSPGKLYTFYCCVCDCLN